MLLCAALIFNVVPCAQAVQSDETMPDCSLTAKQDGGSFSLKQYTGQVLYVDFWASWCGPCAKSFPFLNGLHEELSAQGLRVIGINLDEQREDAEGFLSQFPARFPTALGDNQACAMAFDVKAMPSSYLIDKKGKVRHVHLGFKPDEAAQLKSLVQELLAEKP